MAPRTIRGGPIFWTLTLITGLVGTSAKADPVYTVTNLGSNGVTLTTAGGGTIAVSQFGVTDGSPATNQLASVSNGQVSYAFATTPDIGLGAGQGPLAGFPVSPQSLGISPTLYGPASVAGLLNTNGYAALSLTASWLSGASVSYAAADAVQENANGTFGQPVTITTNTGYQAWAPIAGVNSANQALVGTLLGDGAYDTLVYNLSTHALTDLDYLPQLSGKYSSLRPLAIDNEGQILVIGITSPSTGGVTDTLLLTPGGEPVVATPEPAAWIAWLLLVGASWFARKRGRMRS